MVFFFLINAMPTLLFLCLCTLLGIWLAFGRTHLFIRMPAFLVGTLALGLALCFTAVDTHPSRFILCLGDSRRALAYGCGALLMATIFERTTQLFIRMPMFLLGTCMTAGSIYSADLNELNSGWIVRVAFATSCLAAVVGTLRFYGFRLVNLTNGISNADMDKRTGRELDEWFAILYDANTESLKHAELMAFLRQHGLEYSWQKTVTLAYEKALGRRAIDQASDERLLAVSQETDFDRTDWLTRYLRPRFTIVQWMLFIFCVSSLLGFVRVFDWRHPTTEDMTYGIPMTLGISVFASFALVGCLAVRHVRQNLVRVTWVAIVTTICVLYAMRINPSYPGYHYLFAAMLSFAGLLTASLMLVRNSGYRLVRVQPSDSFLMKTGASLPLTAEPSRFRPFVD